MRPNRLLRLDAVDNARDYGDYATAAGRRVRPGVLFRTAHHARASDADLERMAAWGVATVVDLRRPSERSHQPSRRPAGFTGRVIEVAHDDGGEAPHLTFLKTTDLTESSGRAFMIDTYRSMPFDPGHLDVFARYFRALGEGGDEGQGAVVIHCAAGKDRTGLLAALTHRLLGVHPDDVVQDYLLTNAAVDLAGRAPAIAKQLHAMTGRVASDAAVTAFLGVEPAYLDAAFAAVAQRHGSIETYLEQALGVDAALRSRIVERLSA
ncbi:tyrosine-protein phosphatase [Brevundimonas sp.]|uniref:tyrosine-protein phosphatase n=1 Tax=Brevundimonas sp. TaxID=1871086 RepID=UPI002FD8C5DC